MLVRRLAGPLASAVTAVMMVSVSATPGRAQGHDDHTDRVVSTQHRPTREENELVEAVRKATEQYKHVTSIEGPGGGYGLAFGCVSGGDYGAMGLHYVNMSLVGDGEVDINQPEIILFEPTRNGGIRITGVDFLVLAADWDAKHPDGPPALKGQLFHFFESPNRFGLPAFYTLHVWAWKDNPNGTFVNWNPNVSCDAFNPRS
jgi:hypothetical protein